MSWVEPYEPPEETWGDYIDMLQAGSYAAGANIASFARQTAPNPGLAAQMQQLQHYLNNQRDAQTGQFSPGGLATIQSELGSERFWKNPGNWVALQAVGTVPSVAAALIPAALTMGNPIATVAGTGLISGAMSGGSVSNDWQMFVDRADEAELIRIAPSFAMDIASGIDPEQARENLIELGLGNKHVLAFGAGLASAVGGPAAAAGRTIGTLAGRAAVTGVEREVGKGIIRRGTEELALGAATEGAQGATEEALTQAARIAGGAQEDYDIGAIARAGATEAIVGGALAGGAGAIGGIGARRTGAKPATPSTAPPPPAIQQATLPSSASGGQQVQPTPPPTPPSTGAQPPPAAPLEISPYAGARRRAAGAIPEAAPVGSTVLANPLAPSADIEVALESKTNPALARRGAAQYAGALPAPAPVRPSPADAARAQVQAYQQTTPEQRAARQMVRTYQETPQQPTREFRDVRGPLPGEEEGAIPIRPPTPPPAPPPPVQGPPPTQRQPPPGIAPMLYVGPPSTPTTGAPAGGPISRQGGPRVLPDVRTYEQLSLAEKKARAQGAQATGYTNIRNPETGELFQPLTAGELATGPRDPNDPASVQAWLQAREAAKEVADLAEFRADRRERLAEAGQAEKLAHLTKEEKQRDIVEENNANLLFQRYVSEQNAHATREEVRDRVAKIIEDAKGLGIRHGKKIYPTDPNVMVWMKEVHDLNDDFKTGVPSDKRIMEFLTDELLALGGDFKELRQKRKVFGGQETIGAEEAEEGAPSRKPVVGEETKVPSRVQLLEGELESDVELRGRIERILGRTRGEGKRPLSTAEANAAIATLLRRTTKRKYKERGRERELSPAERELLIRRIERAIEAERKAKEEKKPTTLKGEIFKARLARAKQKKETAAYKEKVEAREEAKKREQKEQLELRAKGAPPSIASAAEWRQEKERRIREIIDADVGDVVNFGPRQNFEILEISPDGVKAQNIKTKKNVTWTEEELLAREGGVPKKIRRVLREPEAEREVTEEVAPREVPKLPLVPKDRIRFFHKGRNPTSGGKRTVVTTYEEAAALDKPGKVYYVDVHKLAYAKKLWEIAKRDGSVELSADWAKRLKPAVASEVTPPKAAHIKRRVKERARKALELKPRGYEAEVTPGTPRSARKEGEEAYFAGLARIDNPYMRPRRVGREEAGAYEPSMIPLERMGVLARQWDKGWRETELLDRRSTPRQFTRPLRPEEVAAREEKLGAGIKELRAAAEARRAPPKAAAIKQRSIKQRLSSALMQVDKNASEAQRNAGNARGGLFNVHGLEIMIQYVKGMERYGSKLPMHYGHIKGYEGADGNPIDVYIGPNITSDTIYVLDQVDPVTGAFDEHKVMFGFDSEFDARMLYKQAFGDPTGTTRVGDITPMSIDEFKTWLAEANKKEPAGEVAIPSETPPSPEVVASEATPTPPAGQIAQWLKDRGYTPQPYTSLRGEIDNWLSTGGLSSIPENIRPQFTDLLNRIQDSIGETPVYTVPQGVIPGRRFGFYDPRENIIVVRSTTPEEGNLKSRLTLHEAAHAGLVKALHENPELGNVLTQAAAEFRAALDKLGLTKDYYAFMNASEFLSEFISNPSMQARLAQTNASDALKNLYRAQKGEKPKGAIRSLFDVVRKTVGRLFGLSDTKSNETLLDIVLGITSDIQARATPGPMTELLSKATPIEPWTGRGGDQLFYGGIDDYGKAAKERVRDFTNPMQTRVFGLKLRSMDQMAQLAKDFGDTFAKATRSVVNSVERMRVRAREHLTSFDPHVAKWVVAERKYRGEMWNRFGEFLIDVTDARVYPDRPLESQKHINPNTLKGAWAASRYPDLARRYQELPEDLQALMREAMEFNEEQQKQMALGIIRNIVLKTLKVRDEGLALRLYRKEELTEEELAHVTPEVALAVKNARSLTAPVGPYFPEMRFGNYVVSGKYRYAEPANAKRVADEDNTFEFSGENAKEEAMAYARTQEPYTSVRTSWVDPETGETYFVDEFENEIPAKEMEGAEKRYRVYVQNKLVEFFDSMKEAQARKLELDAEPNFTVDALGPRMFNPDEEGGREFLAQDIRNLISTMEKRENWNDLSPDQKAAYRQALIEMSLRVYGPTRVQSRRMKRRHVIGASTDFAKVVGQYTQSVAGYRAKLEVQPELDIAQGQMRDSIYDQEAGGQKSWAAKQAIYNEIAQRLSARQKVGPPTRADTWINRLMGWTFVNYLASPAYSVNNALQVGMIGGPQLAARHGAGRAGRALLKAYRTAGIGKIVKAGGKATIEALRGGGRANFFDDIYARVPDQGAREMLRYLRENGTITPDAGLEFDKVIGATRFDTFTDYMQHMARAMPAAVETMNRVVLGLASYELEMRRTGDHQASMEYAQEIVNLSQGNYSRTNMPTFFHNPLLALTFQFKNYGQTIYGMIGHNIGKIMRNAGPGDRAEAIKALTMLAATHVIMAGALGLPTEPIRWLFTGARIAGMTELNWEQVENQVRETMAGITGEYGGELITRGLPRAFGIDLSGRVGAQNLLTFGQPRSDEEYDINAYLGDLLGGAGLSAGQEVLGGINDILHGDMGDGLQRIAPVKAIADSIKAYRLATEGKLSEAGYQRIPPVPITEAFLNAFGYTPARQAEISERAQYFYAAQRTSIKERQDIVHDWNRATPGEKPKILQRMREYNRGRPTGEQLTTADLNNYKKRRASEEVFEGFIVNRRNRELIQSLDIYNTQ